MSLARIMPWLVAALALSAGLMWQGAATGAKSLSAAAAAFAALAVVGVAGAINLPMWRLPDDRVTSHALPVQARRNTRLMALTYAWGSVAMLAVYFLSGLRWWHGWQYGTLMALLAALLFAYAHLMTPPDSRWRAPHIQRKALALTVGQGVLALAGVAWLFWSGKAASPKPDWAANHVFIAGGLAIAALSFIAAATKRRLQNALKAPRRR